MANWIGVARSNYFRVKDIDAFKKEMEGFPGVRVVEHKKEGEAPHFALFGDEGYWPTNRTLPCEPFDLSAPETDEEVEFDAVVAAHLPDDEVAVFQVAGFEKERYVTGYAFAVNSKGEQLDVSIDTIYETAFKAWGIKPTAALY